MDEMSLVSLVMNLLDNAIEACVQTETRQIQVVIAEDPAAQMLELKLQNSKNSSQKLHANEAGMGYQTTKEDRGSHGYGTQIIQRIVDEKWWYDSVCGCRGYHADHLQTLYGR